MINVKPSHIRSKFGDFCGQKSGVYTFKPLHDDKQNFGNEK